MNETIEILGKLMDATALRQKVLSNNLANANTPNYLRKDVKFSAALSDAIDHGIDAIRDSAPEVVTDEESPVGENGNNVTIQKEMGEISQNELLYNFATEMTALKFSGLRKAINNTK